MNSVDLNLLPALDALLSEGSVVGAARRLGLSESAMSRTLGRLRAATGDALLVRAGRVMVLTPHAEALRSQVHATLQDTQALLSPPAQRFAAAELQRHFTLRTNEGFVEAFGSALIAAVRAQAPCVQLRFMPKAEKMIDRCAAATSIWRLAYWAIWDRRFGCRRCFAIASSAWCAPGIRYSRT